MSGSARWKWSLWSCALALSFVTPSSDSATGSPFRVRIHQDHQASMTSDDVKAEVSVGRDIAA
ncbi:MAG: hypothetical protein FD130_1962, partial [Halothiobacillaceae bacterium]